MIKQRKNAGTCRDKKIKAAREKITIQLKEINQKEQTDEGRLKRYRERVEKYRQNGKFQNNKRKFYQQVGGDGTKSYRQPDARQTEQF